MATSGHAVGRLVWTPADEAKLVELTERRNRAMTQNRAPLRELVDGTSCPLTQLFEEAHFVEGAFETTKEEFVDWMINNADSLRDGLLPFDSGVRPGNPSRS